MLEEAIQNNFFSKQLLVWYYQQKRDLPWRKTKDPYRIWLSEIMLQQTRVVQGSPYYEKFITHFPTIFDLAKADEENVLKLWQGLGYYSRAKNLHQTAKTIAFDYKGNFPDDYNGLLKLKGVGDYTASAIASICFGEPCAVVDGNVYRVLGRYFAVDTPINSSQGISLFKKLANQLIDKEQPATYNQAIMDFGALQCKPKNPDCERCIFADSCLAFAQKKVAELPVKINKTKIRKRFFNYLVVFDKQQKTLLNKRLEKDIWQGLFEFPLVETTKETTQRQFLELVGNLPFSAGKIEKYNPQPIVHKLSH